jgi:tetratricopeptide (TPR) repeat protein
MGVFSDLRRRLAGAGAASALAAGLLALGAGPAEARWLKAESPKFIVYSDGDEQALKAYVQKLEVFDDLLRARHGLRAGEAPPRKLPIYLVRDHDGLERVYIKAPETIVGVYMQSEGDIFAVAIRDRKDDSVLFHEYTHHFMLQYFPYGYPSWLIEGVADYYAPTKVSAKAVDVGAPNEMRGYELGEEKWLPLADVLGKTLDKIKPEDVGNFYAESWVLTHYMASDPKRSQQLSAYMRAVAGGADPVKAMEQAAGMDVATLEKTLHAYSRSGLKYVRYDRVNVVEAPVTVTALPPSADDLLLESALLRRGVAKDDRETVLKTVRARAARYPGDALAQLTLARAEVDLGDRKAGEALLDKYLASAPDDVEALELAAGARLDDGDADKANAKKRYQEAQPLIARAFKLDPNRYQTLYTYARSRMLLDANYPEDNTMEALLAAQELAPQSRGVRLFAAQGLMRRKQWDYAAAMLKPLVNDPHSPDTAAVARKLLAEIEEKKAAGAAKPVAK